MATNSRLQYSQLAKWGFLLGLGLFLGGASGELAIQLHLLQVRPWVETLLFDLEVIGIPLFLFSPFVFGIALPLIRG
jgi:hypothetical protein